MYLRIVRSTPYAPIVVVLSLYACSLASFLALSVLQRVDGGARTVYVGLDNYAEFMRHAENLSVLTDTFGLATVMTVASIFIAYPIAYYIVRTPSSALRRILLLLVMGTFLSGGITRAYAWLILLGNAGVFNTLLAALGIGRIQFLYSKLGVGISFVHFMVPFCTLTLVGALQTIPSNLAEAATSLGATRLRTFWTVIFPLSIPGLVGTALLTFSVGSSAFLFPLLLGGGKVRLMSNHIYEIIFTTFNFSRAAVAAVVFLVSTVAIVAVIPWALRKAARAAEARPA